jgi:hypothetical protein
LAKRPGAPRGQGQDELWPSWISARQGFAAEGFSGLFAPAQPRLTLFAMPRMAKGRPSALFSENAAGFFKSPRIFRQIERYLEKTPPAHLPGPSGPGPGRPARPRRRRRPEPSVKTARQSAPPQAARGLPRASPGEAEKPLPAAKAMALRPVLRDFRPAWLGDMKPRIQSALDLEAKLKYHVFLARASPAISTLLRGWDGLPVIRPPEPGKGARAASRRERA